ncbi:unnamed protein product [Acanthosepion pharaonis]|uniref:Uncharacterized protein n=1 Tax=Acanthosepion pharaonis TaxID=158019 RepID=A0A812C0N6_ACAPH|nr:unnamed protein product [Sepia pharaonis]
MDPPRLPKKIIYGELALQGPTKAHPDTYQRQLVLVGRNCQGRGGDQYAMASRTSRKGGGRMKRQGDEGEESAVNDPVLLPLPSPVSTVRDYSTTDWTSQIMSNININRIFFRFASSFFSFIFFIHIFAFLPPFSSCFFFFFLIIFLFLRCRPLYLTFTNFFSFFIFAFVIILLLSFTFQILFSRFLDADCTSTCLACLSLVDCTSTCLACLSLADCSSACFACCLRQTARLLTARLPDLLVVSQADCTSACFACCLRLTACCLCLTVCLFVFSVSLLDFFLSLSACLPAFTLSLIAKFVVSACLLACCLCLPASDCTSVCTSACLLVVSVYLPACFLCLSTCLLSACFLSMSAVSFSPLSLYTDIEIYMCGRLFLSLSLSLSYRYASLFRINSFEPLSYRYGCVSLSHLSLSLSYRSVCVSLSRIDLCVSLSLTCVCLSLSLSLSLCLNISHCTTSTYTQRLNQAQIRIVPEAFTMISKLPPFPSQLNEVLIARTTRLRKTNMGSCKYPAQDGVTTCLSECFALNKFQLVFPASKSHDYISNC